MSDLKSFTPEGFQFAWDATSLTNFMKCPAYYRFVNLEGWQPLSKSVHLIFGGVYATALEHYFQHTTRGIEPLVALREVVREALVETWHHDLDDEGNPIMGTGEPWISGHNTKTRETLIRTIIWYIDQYQLDPEGDLSEVITLASGEPAVELSFSLELTDEYLWCGHIDRMVEFDGQPYVMDQKTTGSGLTAYYYNGFSLDVQMSGYTFAGQVGYNIPVKGVIIDAAQILVGGTKYGRAFVNRSRNQLDEWRQTAEYYIAEAKRAHESGYYPMNTNSCNNYGGCAFRSVCERSPEHRDNFLAADFERRPRWDPLVRR